MADVSEREFTPGQLALVLRVHRNTVQRWCDDGTISCRRTPGGHRKIAAAEAARMRRKLGLPPLDYLPAPEERP